MLVLLLATGETPKLRPLTDRLPPAMAPVGHQPVMAHVVEMLAVQGVRRLVVSLHAHPASIEAYFGGGERWGVTLEYSLQRDALGSAGAVRWARRWLTETFVVVPAEGLIELDLEALWRAHREQGNAATLVLGPGAGAAQGEPAGATGVVVLEPEALAHIPSKGPFDLERDLLPRLRVAGLRVGSAAGTGYWNPLDSWAAYAAANRKFLKHLSAAHLAAGRPGFPNPAALRGRLVAEGLWVGRNNAIHPAARLAAPVYVGKNCRIGRGVEHGPNTVVGDNVILDDEATVSHSVVLDHTYVGKLVKLDHRLAAGNQLVDLASGEHVAVADPFWLSETPTSVTHSAARRYVDAALAALLVLLLLPVGLPWALLWWLACGQPLARLAHARPAVGTRRNVTLFRFPEAYANGLAAWLTNWQRRLELERLPGLLNVLTGELSLVGVKPLTAAEMTGVSDAWQAATGEPAPGFTGLWYVRTHRTSSLDEILVTDAYYEATRNWRDDLRILWQTPAAWVRRLRPSNDKA